MLHPFYGPVKRHITEDMMGKNAQHPAGIKSSVMRRALFPCAATTVLEWLNLLSKTNVAISMNRIPFIVGC